MFFHARTDLASESPYLSKNSCSDLEGDGIHAVQDLIEGFSCYSVSIRSQVAAERIGKPIGQYYTLSLRSSHSSSQDEFSSAVKAVSILLQRCLQALPSGLVLVAALGNPDITPDAIGPLAASLILATHHLQDDVFSSSYSTVVIRTGVLGTTGIESASQLRALCSQLHPSFIIAIDALAGSDADQLCSCVQICNTGIFPGSGVGNDREELSLHSLGVPVIALGVPTVIDASSLCNSQSVHTMFVTPRDIDVQVRRISRTLAYGLNLALHPNLSITDLDFLLG